jgi:hypothetical protein
MKKALVVLLILAVAGGVFAQDLKIGGKIFTGLRFQKVDSSANPTVGLNNDDDDYPARWELTGDFTTENYGAKFGLRNDNFTAFNNIGIYNAYVWADFLQDIVNVKFGLIDDSVWATEGTEGFHNSTGGGLRVELKPLTGLNVGFMVGLPTADGVNPTDSAKGPFFTDFEYVLPETSIGAEYKSSLFNLAAGLKFDSAGDGFKIDGAYVKNKEITIQKYDATNGYDGGTYNLPQLLTAKTLDTSNVIRAAVPGGGEWILDTNGDGEVDGNDGPPIWRYASPTPAVTGPADAYVARNNGALVYAGFALTAITNLTAKLEAQFYNLPAFQKAGYVYIDEVLGYQITSKFYAGVDFTQVFFGSKFLVWDYAEETAREQVGGPGILKLAPYIKFKPNASFQINDALSAGLEVGFALQKDVTVFDINVRPKLGFKLGDNASIAAYYDWAIAKADWEIAPEPLDYEWRYDFYTTTNTVQLNLNWTF